MLKTHRGFSRAVAINTALWVVMLLLAAAFSRKG